MPQACKGIYVLSVERKRNDNAYQHHHQSWKQRPVGRHDVRRLQKCLFWIWMFARLVPSYGLVVRKPTVVSSSVTVDPFSTNDVDSWHPMNQSRAHLDNLTANLHPSRPFMARGLEITFRTIDWCPTSRMLPLQHYRAKRTEKNAWVVTRSSSQPAPNLETFIKKSASYNLSKSSRILIEEYVETHKHSSSNSSKRRAHEQQKQQQEVRDALWDKLCAEHRAALPVPTEALEILYCDEHMVVVNKPVGVLSVPGPRRNPSLAQVVYDQLQPTDVMLDQMVVHRLDMATSGILVYALSREALSKLHRAFKHRHVQKTYQALVEGHRPFSGSISGGEDGSVVPWKTGLEGEIDVDLERDPVHPPFMRVARPRRDNNKEATHTHKFLKEAPKPSLTTWTILSRENYKGQPVTRLELRPQTGRTHQLRVHTSQVLGAPIVGDDIYGQTRMEMDGEGQQPTTQQHLCLHAQKLCIHHPISRASMIFEAEPPF